MQGTLLANAIRWTITGSQAAGGLAGTPGTEVQIINEALAAIARRYPWRWLTRTTQPLSLIADQPYVDLPKDCDEVLEVVRGPGLLTWMEPATEQEMLELRAGTIPRGDSFGFYYTVEHVERNAYNLALSTEDFTDGVVWAASSLTVTAGGLSPQGVSEANTLTGTTTSGTITQAFGFTSELEHGRTFIASLFVKAGTSLASELTLRQTGAAGQTTTRSPLTTVRITWDSGVPTVALQASQGPGAHDVGVEAHADGWYRVWVLLTVDRDEAIPAEALQFQVRPAVLVAGATMVAWGAQLEEHTGHQIDSSLIRPRRYSVTAQTGELVRQLSIWPTPIETRPTAFLLRYRRKPPILVDEAEIVPVPWFIEGVALEACRAVARGWHSEDDGTTFARLDAVWASQDFASAVERDDDTMRKLGPMRGTAVEMLGRGGRDWGRDVVVPPPGGLA